MTLMSLVHSSVSVASMVFAQDAPKPRHNSAADGGFWFTEAASTVAETSDQVFMAITWLSAFFFVLVVGVMFYFMWKYRRRSHVAETGGPTHHTPLELTWSIVPLILVIGIFYIGMKGYMHMRVAPQGAYEVNVTAKKWSWQFDHPKYGASVPGVLHVPAGRPIKLIMTSSDVLHALFIPAFRQKMDVVPGRFTTLWFEANAEEPTEYELYCAEYCGRDHSKMTARVIVYPPDQFETVIIDEANKFPRVKKEYLYAAASKWVYPSCKSCHSVQKGVRLTGPSFYDLWERTTKGTTEFEDGTKLSDLIGEGKKFPNPESYIMDSILNPQSHIVTTYPKSMPTFRGQLGVKHFWAMIDFFKNLDKVDQDGKLIEDVPEDEILMKKEDVPDAEEKPDWYEEE